MERLHPNFSEWNDCSIFGRENRAAPFFVWLESQNRIEPLCPLFDCRAKRTWSCPHLVVRLPYNKELERCRHGLALGWMARDGGESREGVGWKRPVMDRMQTQ
jgi:hypothetical protein